MKYKICVSGAAETGHCESGALEKAKQIGKEVAKRDGVLLSGSTSGMPYWSAIGAKEEGGISIGFSPAGSKQEHVEAYEMPTDNFDLIFYTGFGFSARNLLLMRSADAVIFICGRTGTLNEFTICYEDERLSGVLENTGGTADMIRDVVANSHKEGPKVIYDTDPVKLVDRIIKLIDEKKG